MKFNEGDIHTFQVLKRIDLPDEGAFFVLRHKSGRRLMLSADTYRHYPISAGRPIECRVDKVNCTGNVFLEPKHPQYSEGCKYPFTLIQSIEPDSDLFEVLDCFGNRVKVKKEPKNTIKVVDNQVELVVVRIKKGIPLLSLEEAPKHLEKGVKGAHAHFTIMGIERNEFGDEVYTLQNDKYHRVELKTRHYSHYGFKVGSFVGATILKMQEDGRLKVEPDNPFYEEGRRYEFQIVRIEESESSLEPILIVSDEFSKNIGIVLSHRNKDNVQGKTRVLCRVSGFRKGRPMLVLA